MIPKSFDYARPTTLAEAHAAIQTGVGKVALLAGGQSLLTALKQRRDEVGLVVDLAKVQELSSDVTLTENTLRVSAMTRQADFMENDLVLSHIPIFAEVGAASGDPMLRRQGTVVGAFCEVEINGDWVPPALLLNTRLEASKGGNGETVFHDLRDLVLKDKAERFAKGDIAIAAHMGAMPEGAVYAYRKVRHAAVGWSIVNLAVIAEVTDGDQISDIRLAAGAALTRPQRLSDLEESLKGVRLSQSDDIEKYVTTQLEKLSFNGDHYASPAYRAKRLAVLIKRTLAELSK